VSAQGRAERGGDDPADALAIAICHAHHRASPAARLSRVVEQAGDAVGQRSKASAKTSWARLAAERARGDR
jgi:hypothetical protein